MIQELLGGAGLLGGERKISINGGVLEATRLPPSPSSSSTTTSTNTTSSAAATTTSNSSNNHSENLRCPRCDSSNTKFCYYNNYNLTQPRHFCKTCRRYWTKGGALRNVPIGGGCRKNKNNATVTSSSVVAGKTGAAAAGKMKMVVASDMGRSGFGGSGFDHDQLSPSPILWGSPQSSHLLAMLRSGQNPSPNPNPLCGVKEEAGTSTGMIISQMMSNSISGTSTDSGTVVNARSLSLDPLCQVPSLGLCSSFWRNNQINQNPHYQQMNGLINTSSTSLGHDQAHQNSSNGIQELYQRLRSSSSANYYNDHHSSTVPLNSTTHVVSSLSSSNSSSTSTTSSFLESSAPVAAGGGDQLGFWNINPAFSWSDLPTTTTNGAYP